MLSVLQLKVLCTLHILLLELFTCLVSPNDSFSSGQQQPMRLPYRAKWHLWTSSQVRTVLCESCDQSCDHSGVGVSYTAIPMHVRLCGVVCRAPPVVVLFPWRHTASYRPPAKLNHCYIQVWIQHTHAMFSQLPRLDITWNSRFLLLWQQQYTDISAILLDVHCMAELWFHGSLLYLVGEKLLRNISTLREDAQNVLTIPLWSLLWSPSCIDTSV